MPDLAVAIVAVAAAAGFFALGFSFGSRRAGERAANASCRRNGSETEFGGDSRTEAGSRAEDTFEVVSATPPTCHASTSIYERQALEDSLIQMRAALDYQCGVLDRLVCSSDNIENVVEIRNQFHKMNTGCTQALQRFLLISQGCSRGASALRGLTQTAEGRDFIRAIASDNPGNSELQKMLDYVEKHTPLGIEGA